MSRRRYRAVGTYFTLKEPSFSSISERPKPGVRFRKPMRRIKIGHSWQSKLKPTDKGRFSLWSTFSINTYIVHGVHTQTEMKFDIKCLEFSPWIKMKFQKYIKMLYNIHEMQRNNFSNWVTCGEFKKNQFLQKCYLIKITVRKLNFSFEILCQNLVLVLDLQKHFSS